VNGKIVGGFIVLTALIGGAAIYWLQEYAYYREVAFQPGQGITLTLVDGGAVEPILAENLQGIDADSSPLRFRACFQTPTSLATLTETYVIYDTPEPRVAPSWFTCFDAEAIGAALEAGQAVAFLSQSGIAPGFDRVVAVYPDGRAFAWHQPAAAEN
jgi:DNA-binding transcriptional LysR family regulator